MNDPVDDLIKDYLGETRPVPPGLVQKAKDLMGASSPSAACPHCGKPITPFKKPPRAQKWNALWLGTAVLAFALSFVFPLYFMQFLAAALFCGFKWAIERRALKTQILIYKALSETEHHRLHQHSSRL